MYLVKVWNESIFTWWISVKIHAFMYLFITRWNSKGHWFSTKINQYWSYSYGYYNRLQCIFNITINMMIDSFLIPRRSVLPWKLVTWPQICDLDQSSRHLKMSHPVSNECSCHNGEAVTFCNMLRRSAHNCDQCSRILCLNIGPAILKTCQVNNIMLIITSYK